MKKEKKITVVVGMSGGVDSSVAALLLLKQGYNVIGLHMKSENVETRDQDEQRVRSLCESLGIRCEVVDYSNNMQVVKDYFINEYEMGRTPNPCVVCNREVKFKPFVEFAEQISADYFATGHYARIEHKDGKHILKKAIDEAKDQSYFLCQLSKDQLSKAMFPLGEFTKEEVRKIAQENNLISAETRDSYDICFLGSEKFKNFMAKNYPQKPGKIIDLCSGKIVGSHSGIISYTIGQRKGLGIGGGHGKTGEGWFVCGKDPKENILYVAQGDGEELYSSGLECNHMNWLSGSYPAKSFACSAKFRYRQADQRVGVVVNEDNSVVISFGEKQRAITLGQYVVLYDGDICLGGGVIDKIIK